MKKSLILFLILTLALFSCSKPGANGGTNAGGADGTGVIAGPPTGGGGLGGTSSNGGGNGLKGRALESYIVHDLNKQSYYTAFIAPLIMQLTDEYPQLAADFVYMTRERDWYFIPSEIDQISKNILGTYAATDQMAIQDLNKVWVNSLLFDKMASDEDKATLIVHEILMGVRLMQFKNKQDLCIAKAARHLVRSKPEEISKKDDTVTLQPGSEARYTQDKDDCRKTYPLLSGVQKQNFNLVNEDYDLIRKIVSLLTTQPVDFREVKSLIETNHFRSYED